MTWLICSMWDEVFLCSVNSSFRKKIQSWFHNICQPGDLHNGLQLVVIQKIFIPSPGWHKGAWALFSWSRPFLAEAYIPLFSRQKQKTKSLLCFLMDFFAGLVLKGQGLYLCVQLFKNILNFRLSNLQYYLLCTHRQQELQKLKAKERFIKPR